jgi:hypothetical protein
VRLGLYLLSYGDILSGMSLHKEMETWSTFEHWKLIGGGDQVTFPEEWWGTFDVDTSEIQFPRTILVILKSSFQAATLDSTLPEIINRWMRFMPVVQRVFAM